MMSFAFLDAAFWRQPIISATGHYDGESFAAMHVTSRRPATR